MSSSNPFRVIRADAFYRAVVWTLLLTFCLAGVTRIDILHQVFHVHRAIPAASHSAINESNACHRAIYHEAKSSCGHLSHIVVSDNCQLCDLHVHSDQVVLATTATLAPDSDGHFVDAIASSPARANISQRVPRAPPLA